jgi:3-deoxy-D-manno-oct-2-ulosonic acid (Kdo) hydroxylase
VRARDRRIPDGCFGPAALKPESAVITPVSTLDIASWRPAVSAAQTEVFARELEQGGVLVLPRLAFRLEPTEERFLDPRWSDGRAKNISFENGRVKGARGEDEELAALGALVGRFASSASGLIAVLFPRYAPHLKRARTSYRPQPATGRDVSWRKDDSRLHVDAFPSRPNRGERILRVFCNVNPRGEDRVWRVGERFESMATHFLPRIRAMRRGEATILATLHVTKGRRSEYDHLMLGLHDCAKADVEYQRRCPQQEVRFAPGTTWICFSDQVMHAASGGQFMLEQTIHLPTLALYRPEHSPLAILERLAGRPLAA